MNSKDPENGGAQSSSTSQGPHQGVASGIFKINTALNSYRRLVNTVDKDTPDHGHKLRSTKQRIEQLVKETFGNLKARTGPGAHSDGINPKTNIEDAKLAMDFQATLQNYQKIQGLAIIGREANEQLGFDVVDTQSSTFLEEQTSQETLMLENEIIFNEATIEDRDECIRDIHSQIVEIRDIYRDLAVLIHEQAVGDNIDSIVAAAVNSTSKLQFVKARKSVNYCWSSRYWWMLIILVLLLVVILLYIFL